MLYCNGERFRYYSKATYFGRYSCIQNLRQSVLCQLKFGLVSAVVFFLVDPPMLRSFSSWPSETLIHTLVSWKPCLQIQCYVSRFLWKMMFLHITVFFHIPFVLHRWSQEEYFVIRVNPSSHPDSLVSLVLPSLLVCSYSFVTTYILENIADTLKEW